MASNISVDGAGAGADAADNQKQSFRGPKSFLLLFCFISAIVFGGTLVEMKTETLPADPTKIQHKFQVRTSEIQQWNFPLPNSKSKGPSYRTRAAVSREFNSTIQFIFTMGLEGTGHHLMGTITKPSPAIQRLREMHIWQELVGTLHRLLFSDYAPKKGRQDAGLWNAHCAVDKEPLEMEELLVNQLVTIETQANTMLASGEVKYKKPFPLPLNTALTKGSGQYGEVSYPNYMGPCRPLNYPDLNLLHNACRKAKVDCMQVYLFRHPLEVFNSVVRRGFAKEDASGMQLYIADLHVLSNQMRMYASKTLGCFGFFSNDPEDADWMDAQRDLWVFYNKKKFYNLMSEIYKKPSHFGNVTNDDRLAVMLKESEHAPFLQSWWNAHQHAIQVCRSIIRSRQ